jgi:tetratricopeptide (TPR) repeat protein
MKRTAILVFLFASMMLTVSCQRSQQSILATANLLYEAGKYEEAILNYKKAIQKDQRSGEAYYRLGLADLKKGDNGEAYRALTSASTLLADRTDVKVTLADLALVSYFNSRSRPAGLYAQLTKLSDELMARDPKSYDGYRIKGNLAWTDGRLKEAAEFFQKANAAKPMRPDLVLSWVQVLFRDGQSAEAERLALELIQTHKDAGRIYDVLYGHYRSENRLAEAENILQTKVNNNPREIDYAMGLASFYAATGKQDRMTAVLRRVLDDPKTFPEAHLKVGDFYGAQHDWSDALRQYEEGARADPKNKLTYLKRTADAWLAQDKGDQAAGVVAEILRERPDDAAAKSVNAALLLKTGKPDKIQAGVNDLQGLVKQEPDNPVLRFTLGRGLLATGDQNAARAQFQESLQKHPTYLPSIMALAELSLSKRDYARALEFANRAMSVNPRLVRARLVRTATLMGTRKYTEARSELAGLANDFPQDIDVQFQLAAVDLAERKFPQAEARLQQLYAKDSFRALAGLVDAYRAEGDIDKALSRLKLELGKSPNTTAVHSLLAETAMRASKYDLALEQYEQLEILGVRSSQLQMSLGEIYQLKGDFNKAIASFQKAQDLAPRDPATIGALGNAFRLAGHKAEAMVSYRRVLTLAPENADAMNNLAYILLDTGGAPDEARRLVERALQKSPKNPNFADTLGMVYLKKSLEDSALQVFSGLVQRYPENPVFRYHYGLSLSQKGQKTKAKSELEIALRKSPPDPLRRSIQTSLANIRH